jgi:hypothetical protein
MANPQKKQLLWISQGGGMHHVHPPHAPDAPPPLHQMHPLNSNNINNNINKKLLDKNDQKKHNPIGKSTCQKGQMRKTKNDWKEENQKKQVWAEPPKSPFSDPSKQSTSYKPTDENDKPNAKAIEALMKSLPKHMQPKRYKNLDGGVQSENNSS